MSNLASRLGLSVVFALAALVMVFQPGAPDTPVAFAAARSSSATGNWNATATWGGLSAPVAGDTVTINNGHTVTVTANAAAATITISPGGTLIVNGFALTVTGATSVSGSLMFAATAGAKSFGDFTINSGGAVTSTASPVTITGNFDNAGGSFTSGTGVWTMSGAAKTIGGSPTFGSLAITGTVTTNSDVTVTTALSGAGTLTNGATRTLTLTGTSAITGLTATAVPNTVVYQDRRACP